RASFGGHTVKVIHLGLLTMLLLAGCRKEGQQKGKDGSPDGESKGSLAEARRGFTTKLLRKQAAKQAPALPPAELFHLVRFESPAGKLAAYLSQAPKDGKKHPAIIWIFGGFSNGIGATAWEDAPPENDQSARAFRKAGIMMMYPSLRGGND